MAMLTTDRKTLRKGEGRIVADDAKLAANTTIYNGGMVANNAGALVPASDTASLVTLGISRQKMVNATGSAAQVTGPRASVEAGITAKLDNLAGGNGITLADLGKTCCVVDDHTVGRAAGTTNSIVAGVVDSIDPDGSIWVKF